MVSYTKEEALRLFAETLIIFYAFHHTSSGTMVCFHAMHQRQGNETDRVVATTKVLNPYCPTSFFIFQVCGYEYTYRLQRMFTDMDVSADLNKVCFFICMDKSTAGNSVLESWLFSAWNWKDTGNPEQENPTKENNQIHMFFYLLWCDHCTCGFIQSVNAICVTENPWAHKE